VSNIAVERAFPLSVLPGGTVLLEVENQPLFVAYKREGLRMVTMGFALRDSNLPLTVSFPILITNVMQWLTSRQDRERDQLVAGEPLRWYIPSSLGLTEVTVADPQGVTVTKTLSNNFLAFDGTAMTGVYTIQGNNYLQRFAVNLFNESESNIKPVFFSTANKPLRSSRASWHQEDVEIWQHLLFAALLLLVTEWLYYCRKVSV
jgi:Ca-activated chloride channel homolog